MATVNTKPRERLYTVNEVAMFYRVKPKAVYNWIYTGRLRAKKVGGAVRIAESQIDTMITDLN
jgi:excisionase family DNA binding protein